MAIEDDRGLRSLLRGVLEAPAAGLDDLPELLAMLEHDDPQARVGAAWAICAVAAARPDAAESIRRQLQHRSRTAATLAAEWIERECDVEPPADEQRTAATTSDSGRATEGREDAGSTEQRSGSTERSGEGARGSSGGEVDSDATHDPKVDAVEAADAAAHAAAEAAAAAAETADAAARPEQSADGSGDVAIDGPDAADESGDVAPGATDAADGSGDVAPGGTDAADGSDDVATGATDATADSTDASAGGTDGAAESGGSSGGGRSSRSRPPGTDRVVEAGRFAIELDRTAIDALDVVDRVAMDRCSWTYAGMATVEAEERAVLVRTYRPPEGARLSRFADAFEEQVEAWASVDDHGGVLTVFDHGRRPHPWIVVDYAHQTVRTAGRLPLETALRVTEDAARALAYAHERGVTHRSLDPRSVALGSGDDRPVGRLLNFGLVDAFRAVEGPLPMDSRFAAPELFDDEHGTVDHLTDVYQLGAVLYTALTGRPPYEESLVDRGGPDGVPLAPPSSVVAGVPSTVDRVVETAMATHKIARYEGADEFANALGRALEAIDAER